MSPIHREELAQMSQLKLTCLHNADGNVVGWFNDYGIEMAARREWDAYHDIPGYFGPPQSKPKCCSKEVSIVAAELENVEPGDGDRVDYFHDPKWVTSVGYVEAQSQRWYKRGASVEIQRFLINKYRRPGKSNRDTDLGGPVDAAGVLYVLVVKAPK